MIDRPATSGLPQYVPMQPTLVREPFHRPGWIYEEKVDGWRILAYKDGARVRLFSRSGRCPLAARCPGRTRGKGHAEGSRSRGTGCNRSRSARDVVFRPDDEVVRVVFSTIHASVKSSHVWRVQRTGWPMSNEKDSATEDREQIDREQIERYLKRRRATGRRRAARRRYRYVSVMLLGVVGVVGVGLATWLTEPLRDARGRVTSERQAPQESASRESVSPAPLSAPPAGTVTERTPAERGPRAAARGMPRIESLERSRGASEARTLPPRQPSSLPSPVGEDPAHTRDVTAGVQVPDASRAPDPVLSLPQSQSPTPTTATLASVPTSPLLEETVADRSEWFATVTPTNRTPDDAHAVAPSPSKPEAVTAAVAPPDVPDTVPGPRCDGASIAEAGQSQAGHGQPKSRVVADCVVGWLKGGVQEFRDGAKREIGEFRAGLDRLRRGLQRFGSKLHSSE
jgi:hypothetical protein